MFYRVINLSSAETELQACDGGVVEGISEMDLDHQSSQSSNFRLLSWTCEKANFWKFQERWLQERPKSIEFRTVKI